MHVAPTEKTLRPAVILKDGHGRVMEYIRVSLTEQCNYSCPFCMPSGVHADDSACARLSSQEILRLCRIISGLGVSNFKITGGEPLLYPGAMSIIKTLKQFPNVKCVTITTNGSTLHRDGARLTKAGVDGVNVSLNAIHPETYSRMIGGAFPVEKILKNIILAKKLGLHVKVNMVPIRGLNDDDIIPVTEFALEHNLYLRFIELMPIGQGSSYEGIPRSEILKQIETRFGKLDAYSGRLGNGPATYYSIRNHGVKIGYIAAVSQQFCSSCNRIRLSAKGFLRTCLHHNHGIDLSAPLWNGANDSELQECICEAVAGKPAGHDFFHNNANTTPMYRVGG